MVVILCEPKRLIYGSVKLDKNVQGHPKNEVRKKKLSPTPLFKENIRTSSLIGYVVEYNKRFSINNNFSVDEIGLGGYEQEQEDDNIEFCISFFSWTIPISYTSYRYIIDKRQ